VQDDYPSHFAAIRLPESGKRGTHKYTVFGRINYSSGVFNYFSSRVNNRASITDYLAALPVNFAARSLEVDFKNVDRTCVQSTLNSRPSLNLDSNADGG
jgi:hypothetical protein